MSKYDCDLDLNARNSLSVLIQQVEPNSTVLEFGPANGRMTKYMKEQLNCQVYAVEIDEKSAADAAQYTEKMIVDSIENYAWMQEFKGIQFDYIIFADVLEHLYYPEKVLRSVKGFLKANGSILISIPNIAHNSIIINLLKNEFNYSPTGLLDDTHIRFFTKKTFDQLIEKTGLFRSFETAIFINPENTEFLNSYADLPKEVSDFLCNQYYGEAYQFIYELKQAPCTVISDFSDDYKVYSQFFSQLFLDHGKGISEENSIKLPVANNTDVQEFIFDLSDKPALISLRLDPLNDSCVIEIESLRLIREDGEIDLLPFIHANASLQHGKSYFFKFIDPQIYFEGLGNDKLYGAKKLIARIRYPHIARDAVRVSMNQLAIDKDTIIKSKNQEIETLQATLNQKIESKNTIIEEKEQIITEYAQKLQDVQYKFDKILLSSSWKITKPLRRIKQMLKG